MISPSLLDELSSVAAAALDETDQLLSHEWGAKVFDASGDVQYQTKADGSPLTSADCAAEDIIRGIIRKSRPMDCIIGEERGQELSDVPGQCTWVLDPLDGTRNFVRKLPFFATQLAVFLDGAVVLGASSAPALGERVFAISGRGTMRNGTPVRVAPRGSIADCYVVYGGLRHFAANGLLDGLARLASECWCARGFGDSWSYHMLANGSIDVVVEASAKIWDVAAASLIVQEAGGAVTDLRGKPVTISSSSLVATNGASHDAVLEYFRARG
jgi:histidinol-phosphatase